MDEPLYPSSGTTSRATPSCIATRTERLTIDVDLRFTGPNGERDLEGIVIAELKQERADRTSPFVRLMRAVEHATGGHEQILHRHAAAGRPNVKRNAFKDSPAPARPHSQGRLNPTIMTMKIFGMPLFHAGPVGAPVQVRHRPRWCCSS